MKLFTRQERTILQVLALLLLLGLGAAQLRRIIATDSQVEIEAGNAERAAFLAGVDAYLASAGHATGQAGSPMEDALKVNINQADIYELQALPGVGPVLAQRIVRYRQENGEFQDIQALRQVRGIGPKLLARWNDLLVIRPEIEFTAEREQTVE